MSLSLTNTINTPTVAGGGVPVTDTWRTTVQADVTAGDSDKTFTVPASTEWLLNAIWIEYTSSIAVGDRQVTVELQTPGSVVYTRLYAGAVQAASLVWYYQFAPGIENMAAPFGTYLSFQLPPVYLAPTYKVRVYDSAAIAVGGDTMKVWLSYLYRTV